MVVFPTYFVAWYIGGDLFFRVTSVVEVKGLWLAVGISDLLVTLFIVFLVFKDRLSGDGKTNC